jgi:hypothetical protein
MWVGHALIGSSFSWSDFPYYGAGALLAIAIVRIFRGSRWLPGGVNGPDDPLQKSR